MAPPARSDDAEDLPAATAVDRLTWTRSPSMTRLEFHGRAIPAPEIAKPSERMLRIDFTATDASRVPTRLDVGTGEITSILRIPPMPGVLPDHVSARFLVMLVDPDLSWRMETGQDRLTIFVGVPEKAGTTGLSLRGSSYVSQATVQAAELSAADTGGTEAPALDEMLPRSMAFAVPAAQPIRSAASDVAAESGYARKGETKLADARRGDWVHLVGGGWMRLPESATSTSASAAIADTAAAAAAQATGEPGAGSSRAAGRSAAAWSVVTLGTGLQADILEVLPGEPFGEPVVRLFREPVRLARLALRVQGGQFAYQLPPKRGRVQITLKDGRSVESLDPRDLALVNESQRPRLKELFEAPPLAAGDEWQTVLVFPGDIDFLQVDKIRIDVGGQMHGLFRVPGSGDPIEDDDGAP